MTLTVRCSLCQDQGTYAKQVLTGKGYSFKNYRLICHCAAGERVRQEERLAKMAAAVQAHRPMRRL